MPRLSVNVNKVATVRNSRGGRVPSVVEAARVAVEAGAPGITVHPRADERHIRPSDVRDLVELLRRFPHVELNIEGDPRPDLMALVREVQPAQCTLVPVLENEVTSQGGWPASTDEAALSATIAELRGRGIRVSVFIDAQREAVEWAAGLGPDRVELFTEPYAIAFREGDAQASFGAFAAAAEVAHALGLGVNAGHDLDAENLVLFRSLPHLAEVSIGHALISEAIFEGLAPTVRRYLDILAGA
jgi:pyridoxine 5-phosphate synthase